MSWVFLGLAVLLEVAGTTCMKLSAGFARVVPSVLMGIFYVLSLSSLTLALRRIDVSMAYAIWSGLGTALLTLLGAIVFKEAVSPAKLASIALIVVGVVALHLTGSPR